RPAFLRLCEALVPHLPLQPLEEHLEQSLTCSPDELSAAAGARLGLLKFMTEMRRRSRAPQGSTLRFPHEDVAWANGLRLLDNGDRTRVLGWCVGLFEDVGVTRPAEARGLAAIFHSAAVDSPAPLAEAAKQLLAGRDTVTCVLLTA